MDSIPPLPGSSPDEMFPVLTTEQQARVLAHGRARKVASGETLVELNQQPTKIFVVVEGQTLLACVGCSVEVAYLQIINELWSVSREEDTTHRFLLTVCGFSAFSWLCSLEAICARLC